MRLPQVSSNTAVVTGPISAGCWVNRTPRPTNRSCSARTSSTTNAVAGIPSSKRASLNGFGRRVTVGFEHQLDTVGVVRADHCDPARAATHRHVVLEAETQCPGVEPQRPVLIVDEHTDVADLHDDSLRGPLIHRCTIGSSGAVSM